MAHERAGDGAVHRLPLFEGLFEAAPDAIIVVDDRGLIRFVNRFAERLFGYPRDDLVGRPIEVLVPERFHEAHRAHRPGYLRDPQTRPMGLELDLSARRRDGTEFPADVSLSFIPTFEGDFVATAVRDATARRRTEGTLVALNEVAFAAGMTLDPVRLATFVVGRARTLLGVNVASVHWWSEEQAALLLLARDGLPGDVPVQRIEVGQGAVGTAFARREAVVLDEYAVAEKRLGPWHGLRSAAAVPFVVGDRALGTLYVGSHTARHWDPEDIRLLSVLAAQAGPAIEMGQIIDRQQRQSALYATVLQAQADLHEVALMTRGDGIVWTNSAFRDLIGQDPSEVASLPGLLALVVPEERDAVAALWRARSLEPGRFDVHLRRADGVLRLLQVALRSVPPAGADDPLTSVVLIRDGSDRVSAEERFERVFRLSPVGMTLSRRSDGVFVDVNDSFLATFGYTRDEFIGRTALDLGLWQDPAQRAAIWSRLDGEGRVRDLEMAFRAKAGAAIELLSAFERVELDGLPLVLGAFLDITERKRAEAELERRALHDALTDLPNRALFNDRLEWAFAAAGRSGTAFTVLYLDLNDFKEVNDAFGHEAGDELLRAVGERLRGALRGVDTIARFGGDEFAILLPGTGDADAVVAARRVLDALRAPFTIADRQVPPEASVGVVLWPNDGATAGELLRHADVAMYAAKRAGGGYAFYTRDQDQRSKARLSLRADLHGAIERGELFLEYQPMVDLRTGACVRVEALVRWRHPARGVVPPDEFIPFAEESGFILPLGLWVLEEALGRSAERRADGTEFGVSVNLSARNLVDPGLVGRITELLARWSAPPSSLTIEITESAVMAEPERALGVLRALHDRGVRLAIDDFGTGYSSLSYLQRLPVSEVKVDRSFVGRMMEDPNSAAIVRSTIDLGHSLGLAVTAEGVEDKPTRDRLRALGCDVIQGFLIARPMPADALRAWLNARPAAPV